MDLLRTTNSTSGRSFAAGISITPGRLKLLGTKVNFSAAFAAIGDICEKKKNKNK